MTVEPERHAADLPVPPDEALDAVREAAEIWGATWHRLGRAGRLELPVSAGLRYGMLAVDVASRPEENGATIELQVEDSGYRVHLPSLSVIVVGAVGAITMILAPLVPGLFALVPVGFIVMLCAWFLVLSRLQHRGPREFLDLVRDVALEQGSGAEGT